jgi:hypothetical protein
MIRVKFDDTILTTTIARLLLQLYDIENPDRAGLLPPDFLLHRPDVQRALGSGSDETTAHPGRPKRAGSYEVLDRPLVQKMNKMVSSNGTPSPTAAATLLVREGRVSGGGSPEAKIRRLVKRYKSIFGDAG